MKTQKYLVTIEMPDGDMISPGWIREIIQDDCDFEDKGRQKVSVEEIKAEESPGKTLDEAAEEYAFNNWEDNDYHTGASEGLHFDAIGHTANCFKAGAKWMAGQGAQLIGRIKVNGMGQPYLPPEYIYLSGLEIKEGDKVIVQIRKKEESK